ncbi:TonB-dependent receptor [Maricurvus nonylphenolicus]|uniref:TonB-dependent receptor n=1 Tax=Maricurvus nonylphenolicus TaxID=1008307 RepID=UPI0036F40CC5
MKNLQLNTLSASILATLTVSTSTHIYAQDDDLLSLEEVVVTAERRSQTLQEIPLAISAVSGDKIERSQITRTDDITSLAPGLQISSGRLGEQKVVIRGVGGSVRDNIAASPKVAMFIDDVYVSRGAAMDMAFFDLDRVEVLRGPQGTLYGKNAIAGAVNVHSKMPSDEFEAKFSVTAGNYDTRQTRFMVGGPLSENLSGKFVGGSNERDGFTKNLTTGNDLSREESYFGRATLLFEGEQWDLRAIMDYEHNPSNPGTAMHINNNNSSRSSTGFEPLALAPGFTVTSPDDRHEVTTDQDGEGSQTNQGFSFKASYSGEDIVFESITGYRDIKNSFTRDNDNHDSSLTGISINNVAEDDSWSVSQEFRVSSVDTGAFTMDGDLFWTVGLYLFHDEGEREEFFNVFVDPIIDNNQFQSLEIEGDTIALYGQGTYTVNEKLDVTFGLRYSYEEKEAIHGLADGLVGVLVDELEFSNVKVKDDWTQLSPKLTANYQLTEEVMLYATYSKGSLGGGFNFGPANAAQAATDSFDQENADNFEVGIKGSAWDNRLQYTASAFYIDYQDLQVQGVNSSGATITTNASDATSQGVELELTALVAEGLTLNANYAYVDATFDAYCEEAVDNSLTGAACTAAGGIDNKGNQLEYSSEHVFNFSAEYVMALADAGDLIFATNYSYSSDQYFGPDNTSGQDAYDLIDASVAFESADGNWFVSVWGKNLTDEGYNVDFIDYGSTSDGAAYVQGSPRTYGATVTWTY